MACGQLLPKWEGRCPACGAWNSVEAVSPVDVLATMQAKGESPSPISLETASSGPREKVATGFAEADRVLGGGLVPGSLLLLGGDPGVGKSTLALQIGQGVFRATGRPVLYCSGEESPAQLADRAQRVGCDIASLMVLDSADIDAITATLVEKKPPLAIVDSVQTARAPMAVGVPGSPAQIREAIATLLPAAKKSGVPILLIAHVTKDGAIAGPRTLEHMVDVVLYFEGERHGELRLLRGVKNRFGSTGELGVFRMSGSGIEEVEASGKVFFDEGSIRSSGSALTVVREGRRPLVVEVQALTVKSPFGLPRRTTQGFEANRLHLLLAVLERRAGVRLSDLDAYVNVVGGMRLADPGSDLAVALALVSALRDITLAPRLVVLGEVGLGGEVRRVPELRSRLAEAANLGMEFAIIPDIQKGEAGSIMPVIGVTSVTAAVTVMAEPGSFRSG